MKINIGGFKHHQYVKATGWTIVDNHPGFGGQKVDLHKENLPYPTDSVEAVYTSHTLEHILPHRQRNVFAEMYRVLQPEGMLRIVVPDVELAINRYVNKETLKVPGMPSKQPSLPDLEICELMGWFFTYREQGNMLGGHVMGYNEELLRHYLAEAKFRNIEMKKYDDCSPIFNGADLEMHKDFALYIEAQK